jgi:hypothetical protein
MSSAMPMLKGRLSGGRAVVTLALLDGSRTFVLTSEQELLESRTG